MIALAWKTLRARASSFAGAFIALLCGAAVIAASGILVESGLRASVAPYRYAEADAVISGDQSLRVPGGDFTAAARLPEPVPLPGGLVDAVAAAPEVEQAVGDHHLALAVGVPDSERTPVPVSGHGWDTAPLGPFSLVEGEAPRSGSEAVLPAGLADLLGVSPGDRIELVSAAAPASYTVSGLAVHEDEEAAQGDALFLSPEEARRLAGGGDSYDAVGVLAAAGTGPAELAAALEAAAGGTEVSVHSGASASRVEFSEVGEARGLLMLIAGSLGGLAVLTALFVVANTLALSLHARSREFALLRAIGATPWQILRMVGAEVLLLSAVAGVLGCLPGIAVAEALRAAFVRLGVIPEQMPLAIGPLPLLGAVLLIVAAALVSGFATAARPALAAPTEALRASSVPAGRTPAWRRTAGLICLVLGVSAAMTPVALRSDIGAAGASSSALLLIIGVALLGPVLLRPIVAVLARPLRRIGVSGFLAAAGSEADQRRLSAVLTPLVLAVGFTLAMVYTQSVLARATDMQVEEGLTADAVITDTGSTGIGPQVRSELRGLPEVGTATPVRETQVFVPFSVFGDPDLATFSARGVAPEGLASTMDLGAVDGDLADLRGEAAALEHSSADLLGAEVGDDLEVHLGDGAPATLRLVATYERGLGFGDMTVPEEVLREHTAPPSRILVGAAEGSTPEDLAAALAVFTERYPTLARTDGEGFADGTRAESRLAAWVNFTGLAVILGYIAIAVVNTLAMSTAGRSREFALLRLIGTTRGQVLRSLRLESLVLVLLAALLGTLVALVPLAVLSLAFLGTPVPAGSPLVYLGTVGATALLGFVSVMLPARWALRARPVDAIGLRE